MQRFWKNLKNVSSKKWTTISTRKAPQQIAADLAEKIDQASFEKIEVVGPYLNFFMDKKAISAHVLELVLKD